jgi:HSP20 family protein
MALVRRDVFNGLFNDVNRFPEEFQRMFGRNLFGHTARWVPTGPAVNVWADEQAVYAEVDLPGTDVEKLDVSVTEGNKLTIQGERPVLELPNAVWHRQERGAGSFTRTLTLPTMVDANKVEAKYENGVLRLTLPRAEAAKPRKIAIKA